MISFLKILELIINYVMDMVTTFICLNIN